MHIFQTASCCMLYIIPDHLGKSSILSVTHLKPYILTACPRYRVHRQEHTKLGIHMYTVFSRFLDAACPANPRHPGIFGDLEYVVGAGLKIPFMRYEYDLLRLHAV